MTAAANTNAMAVTLTVDELRSLVREAVRAELGPALAKTGDGEAEVLNRVQAAKLLGVNPHLMPKLIRDGLPAHRLGATKWRFRRSELLEWLGSGPQKRSA